MADFIRNDLEAILLEWDDFANSLAPLAKLDQATLRDHARDLLVGVVADMAAPQTEASRSEKGKGRLTDAAGALGQAASLHGAARLENQFSLEQVAAEFRAVRACVLRRWAASGRQPSAADIDELTRFNEAIDLAWGVSAARYAQKVEDSRVMILGVLAHDLRTPLNAVSLGMQYILASDSTDASTSKVAAKSLRSVARMSSLIRDLLDYTHTRLGTGLPVRFERANIGALCTQAAEEAEASNPGRQVACSVSGEVDGEVDAERVAQMLVNLIANALHHGDPSGTVTVAAAGRKEAVQLTVHNDGPAIPASARANLFKPLKRSAVEARGGASGSSGLGLGLYIACQIAQAHHGSLAVASTAAKGTTFTAVFPRRQSKRP